jgi:hypothetical protein
VLNLVVHKRSVSQIVIGLLLILLLALATHTTINASANSEAANEQRNLKLLLERMDGKLRNEKGFIVIIDFINPLLADEKSWSIGDPSDKYNRSINEIGDDYLCFKEQFGQGPDFIRCTPFSNIVSVDYLDD